LIKALVWRRESMRWTTRSSSMETPIQTFSGQSSSGLYSFKISARLVRSWKRCLGFYRIPFEITRLDHGEKRGSINLNFIIIQNCELPN
jgi:hypothetical protein